MAEITAAKVQELRKATDLPMMDCKKALVEAEGDTDRAMELLRERNRKKLAGRSNNETGEGQVFVKVSDDGKTAAMVEIVCESAPVGSGEHLSNFGQKLVEHLYANPGIETVEQLMAATPEGGSESFQAEFDEMVGKIREKIVVNRIVRLENEGHIGSYTHHDKKTGVLFLAEGETEDVSVLRDVAMHIAALRPGVVQPEELDESVVSAERTRLSDEAKASGKPDNVVEKIVDGQMKKFYETSGVLTYQPFAKDDSKSVSQALQEKGFKAVRFERFTVGQ